mgnify:CR=1 FL=1
MADDPWEIGCIEELWKLDNANPLGRPGDYLPEDKDCKKRNGKEEPGNFRWRAERDYSGEINDLHLLNCKLSFGDFVNEYSVGRLIKADGQELLRKYLVKNDRLVKAMRNPDGSELDKLACELKDKKLTNHICRSLISKVAALAKPKQFIPYDSYARRGVAKVRAEHKSCFNGILAKRDDMNLCEGVKYSDTLAWYYESVSIVLEKTETEVREYYRIKKMKNPTFETFHRRIVDMFLMAKGGRYDHSISPWEKDHPWQKIARTEDFQIAETDVQPSDEALLE